MSAETRHMRPPARSLLFKPNWRAVENNKMKTNAAIYPNADGELFIDEVELESPRADELLVRISACGICHTDFGMMGPDAFVPLPLVLGHEGVGVVAQVGADVTEFQPGDKVLLSIDHCGTCAACDANSPAYCEEMMLRHFSAGRPDGSSPISYQGKRMGGAFFAQSSFANHAIAPARAAVLMDQNVPLELMAPLGCGVQTGAGTILNIFKPSPGQGVAIFGVGTVGLSAVMAAKYAGCKPIVVVDKNPERLALASELGADICVDARTHDPLLEIHRHTNDRGVDFSFDNTGSAAVIRTAMDCLYKNGVCAIATSEAELTVNGLDILLGKTLRGTLEGNSVPRVFIPQLVEMYQQGHLPLEKLVKFYAFEDIHTALEDAKSGAVVKPILRMV